MNEIDTRLDDLDTLRFDDPNAAAREALALAGQSSGEDRLRAMGVVGSCYRILGDCELAFVVVREAVGLARERGMDVAAGELCRRLAYILLALGQPARAVELCLEGASHHGRAFDLRGLSRAQVDLSMALFHSEDYPSSMLAAQGALTALDEQDERNRFAALIGLSRCLLRLEDLDGARSHLDLARPISVPPALQISVPWLEAELDVEVGDFRAARNRLAQVVAFYNDRKSEPYSLAFACCDLVEVCIIAGWYQDATAQARKMAALLTPLRRNPIAESAIAELVRCSISGRLSVAAVEAARQTLQREQARHHRAMSGS